MLASIPAARDPDPGVSRRRGTALNGTPTTTTHAELRCLTVDGLRLAERQYRAKHDGVPLVLLSRFHGTIGDWDPNVLSRLTARRRVIAFDNAGIGLSEGTVQSSITEMADTVLGFVDALGLMGGR